MSARCHSSAYDSGGAIGQLDACHNVTIVATVRETSKSVISR